MSKMLFVLIFASVVLVTPGQEQKPLSELIEATKSRYKSGQVWRYKTRPGEEDSSLIVVKVENHPKMGNIIHIGLRNLRMKNPHNQEGYSDTALHLPFAEEAIDKSVVKILEEKAKLPAFEEGYSLWREAFDAGKAGIYTITIAEAVEIMEKSLNQ